MKTVKTNARNMAGTSITELAGSATAKNKTVNCSAKHIKKLSTELQKAGLALRDVNTLNQQAALLKVLAYLGPRGLNTYEGTAIGYARLATRIHELEESWVILSLRENVIGPDGLFHPSVARYVLIGKRDELMPIQRSLELEDNQ